MFLSIVSSNYKLGYTLDKLQPKDIFLTPEKNMEASYIGLNCLTTSKFDFLYLRNITYVYRNLQALSWEPAW